MSIVMPNQIYVNLAHEKITPLARYCPWNLDKTFINTFLHVYPATVIDIYRLYELWTAVGQSAKLKEGDIIDIGTWRGGSGVLMAKKAMLDQIDCSVYLCDTFKGIVKAGEHDSKNRNATYANTTVEMVEALAKNAELNNIKILEGIFPDETGRDVEDCKFRFCHIDTDTYQSSHDIMEWIWERLIPGGIVIEDDYGFEHYEGITKHVNEQMKLKDRVVFYNLNGHSIMVKL